MLFENGSYRFVGDMRNVSDGLPADSDPRGPWKRRYTAI